MIIDSDLKGIPIKTAQFIQRISELGLDRERIHGLFVLLGLYVGAPRDQEEFSQLMFCLDAVLPDDRSKNLDSVVGEFWPGYEQIIDEFCFRSGLEFKFREVSFENIEAVSIIKLRSSGKLDPNVVKVDNLSKSNSLILSLLKALGEPTAKNNRCIIESYQCGVFQTQLYARSDINGAQQLSKAIYLCLPLFIGRLFKTVTTNTLDYFMGLELGQVALYDLLQPLDRQFVMQLWGFQSSLFFYEGKKINDVEKLDLMQWHRWVLDRAKAFDAHYIDGIVPFSTSGINLENIPIWPDEISDHKKCNEFIYKTWGYSLENLRNCFDELEYKALIIYIIFASLTKSREVNKLNYH